jgi:hypothetical protein
MHAYTQIMYFIIAQNLCDSQRRIFFGFKKNDKTIDQ